MPFHPGTRYSLSWFRRKFRALLDGCAAVDATNELYGMKVIQYKPSSLIVVALGANLPFEGLDPGEILNGALRALAGAELKITLKSAFYRTPCFPAGAGPDYVNAVIALEDRAARNPSELLRILHSIEHSWGRERVQRWAGRTLDLDLIAAGDSVLPDLSGWRHWRDLDPEAQQREAPDQLILPHPRLQDRAFVLVPMADILPDWRHPVSGQSVLQMLEALPEADRAGVVRLS